MPQHIPSRSICGHCDGFPTVTITTGQTAPNGQRQTITAHCPACHGTGHTRTSTKAVAA